ncbi:hypothetical protein T08_15133, partial [Trichinella sp. T8]
NDSNDGGTFKKSWDTKKVRPAYIRERVVTPRTPVTNALQTYSSQYIRTLCDYCASVVYWNIECGHTPNVSNKSCST